MPVSTTEFTDGDATRILQAIEDRIRRRLKNGALMMTTWGRVASTDAGGANVYLYDELTLETVASEGFRIPNGRTVAVNDMVKVWIDKSNGERWIDPATTSYADPLTVGTLIADYIEVNNEFTLNSDLEYLRIQTDGVHAILVGPKDQTSNVPFRIGPDGEIEWGSGAGTRDVNLYRDSANVLKTDDQLSVNSLRIEATTDAALASTAHGFQIGATAGTNIIMDGNEIMARNNGAVSTMSLQADGGRVGINQNNAPTSGAADGLIFGADVLLYRGGADLLATDDSVLIKGDAFVGSTSGAGQSVDGVKLDAGGAIELRSANPFIDFKMSDVDFGARIIYDFDVSDNLEFRGATTYDFDAKVDVAGDLVSTSFQGSTVDSGSGTVTIAGDGTATFSAQTFSWVKYGRLVVFECSVTVSANGSGSSTVTFTFPGSPPPTRTSRVLIDRGGTSVNAIFCRTANSGGAMQFSDMKPASTFATITGVDLLTGQGYSGTFCYMAA
jgi:hypothetical protein